MLIGYLILAAVFTACAAYHIGYRRARRQATRECGRCEHKYIVLDSDNYPVEASEEQVRALVEGR